MRAFDNSVTFAGIFCSGEYVPGREPVSDRKTSRLALETLNKMKDFPGPDV
jgi:hypothetical protein